MIWRGRLACPILSLSIVAAIACGGPVGDEQTSIGEPLSAESGVLTFGSVSLTPASEFETVRPFANYVASQLGNAGIGRGRVVVVDSLSKMVEEIERGTVDVFIDSPFPVGFVLKRADVDVVLRRSKRGSDTYRSVIFTRADSNVNSLDDLAGKIVAFGAPFSTSGFLMPKAALASAGLNLVNYEDAAASIPSDRVGYVFSNDAENTMFWVLKRKVVAGAVNEDYFEELAGSRIDDLRIIHTTGAVPRNLVCVRSDLDPEVRTALVKLLLGLHHDELGRSVLDKFEETRKFDLLPGGSEAYLAGIMELLPFVEEDLGQ
jgi:phosphonate transport system substrate-binding protein